MLMTNEEVLQFQQILDEQLFKAKELKRRGKIYEALLIEYESLKISIKIYDTVRHPYIVDVYKSIGKLLYLLEAYALSIDAYLLGYTTSTVIPHHRKKLTKEQGIITRHCGYAILAHLNVHVSQPIKDRYWHSIHGSKYDLPNDYDFTSEGLYEASAQHKGVEIMTVLSSELNEYFNVNYTTLLQHIDTKINIFTHQLDEFLCQKQDSADKDNQVVQNIHKKQKKEGNIKNKIQFTKSNCEDFIQEPQSDDNIDGSPLKWSFMIIASLIIFYYLFC